MATAAYALTFVLAAASVIALTWHGVQRHREQELAAWRAFLSGVAADHLQVVSAWLFERRADAAVLAANPLVTRLFPAPVAVPPERLLPHLERVVAEYGYSGAFVSDAEGRTLARSGSKPLPPEGTQVARAVAREGRPRTDVLRVGPQSVLLAFTAPVFAEDGPARSPRPAAGVVTLLIEPRGLLALFAVDAPHAPSAQSCLGLVRRGVRGAETVWLRPRPPPSMSPDPLPSNGLAFEGPEVFVEFADARGVPVLAAARRVLPEDWILVHSVDRSDALRDFRLVTRSQVLAGGLLILNFAGLLVVHRQHVTARLLGQSLERHQERERLRVAAEASQRRFLDLVHGLDAVVWESDAARSRLSFVSEGTGAILGCTAEQLLSEADSWVLGVHPEDRERVLRVRLGGVFEQKQDSDVEYRFLAPDGRVAWLRDKVRFVPASEGCPGALRGVTMDVTKRKRAERRQAAQFAVTRVLAESETLREAVPKLLRVICEGLEWDVGGLWTVDREAGVLRCYDVWHKLSASPAAFVEATRRLTFGPGIGLPGRVWTGGAPCYVPDVLHDTNFLRAEVAAADGLHAAFAVPVRAGTAVTGVLDFFSAEIRPPDDDLLAMMADIGSQVGQFAERRRAEEEQARLQVALRNVALEWRRTFDSIESPLLVVDLGGRVQRLNQAARASAGRAWDQAVGCAVEDLGAGQPWAKAAEVVALVRESRAGASVQERDATTGKTWDFSASLISVPGDEEARIILALRDVTAWMELQETLRRQETMAAMGALVAGVAHQVRNPLFGISSNLDAFETRFGSRPEYRGVIGILRGEVERLAQLMTELLEYGKPAAPQLVPGAVEEVVARAVRSCEPLARRLRVGIANRVRAGLLPPAPMDQGRLVEAFRNVIENAVEHSAPGQTVTVQAAAVRRGRQAWIECIVEDSGPGFAPDDVGKVFEPFFTRRPGGTGLGLSIAQRIVEGQGGSISAANRPEGGGRSLDEDPARARPGACLTSRLRARPGAKGRGSAEGHDPDRRRRTERALGPAGLPASPRLRDRGGRVLPGGRARVPDRAARRRDRRLPDAGRERPGPPAGAEGDRADGRLGGPDRPRIHRPRRPGRQERGRPVPHQADPASRPPHRPRTPPRRPAPPPQTARGRVPAGPPGHRPFPRPERGRPAARRPGQEGAGW